MPIGDKITKANNGVWASPATLMDSKPYATTTVGISIATGWPVDATDGPVHFKLFKVDNENEFVEGSASDWKGTLTGTTLSNMVKTGGPELDYETGDPCIIYPTAGFWNDIYSALVTSLNKDGSLKTDAVKAALGITSLPPADWTVLPVTPTVTANNGQKEHVLRFADVDYRDRLQPGTRLRIPRIGTIPAQSGRFIASSLQYASKSTPANISFNDDYTIEALVRLDAYPTGGGSWIISRINAAGSSGWGLQIAAEGAVSIFGLNGAGQSRVAKTYQSIPLGKAVHIAACMDASTPGNIKIYIDGVEAPYVLSGTATSITQPADALAIGRYTSGEYITAAIAEVRLWNTVRSVGEIRDNMAKQLAGDESGLIGYWKLNGDFNDTTTNANHLTSSGGAIATYDYHPFSSVEYAIVTKVALNSGNTDITVFSGPTFVPPVAFSAMSYSSLARPFGFPGDRGKWIVAMINRVQRTYTPAVGSFATTNMRLSVPTGGWRLISKQPLIANGSPGLIVGITVSTSTSGGAFGTEEDINMTARSASLVAGLNNFNQSTNDKFIDLSTQTFYYILAQRGGTDVDIILDSDNQPNMLIAECSYI